MISEKIESIIFQNKTKDQLIENTLSSLSGLLADVFNGDDVVEISIDLIQEKTQYEIGTYSLIFDENCEQIDEILVMN
jgi:hypothetical protein